MVRWILLSCLSVLIASSAVAAPQVVQGRSPLAQRSIEIVFRAGDTTDSEAIPVSGFCTVRYEQVGSDDASLYSVATEDTATSSGTLIAAFTSSTSSATTFTAGTRWVKAVATDATAGGSVMTIECAPATGAAGGVVGSGPLADMLAYNNPQAGDIWQQTDDDGTGDCATDGGTDSALLCQYNAATSSWVAAGIAGGTDNLGNHTATTDLDLDGNDLLNGGTIEGQIVTGAHVVSQYASLDAAITAACAGSKDVYVDADVAVATGIEIDGCDYLRIHGNGPSTVITGAAGETILTIRSDWVTIEDLYITHASANAANIAIHLEDTTTDSGGVSNFVMRRVFLQGDNTNGYGIYAKAMVSSQIVDSDIWGWEDGLFCEENILTAPDPDQTYDCNAIQISGSRFKNNTGYGVRVEDVTGELLITGSTIEGNDTGGVLCDDGAGLGVIVGTHMEQPEGAVDVLRDDLGGGTGACAYVLIGNRFGSVADWNYLEDIQGSNRTRGFGNYWRAGWNVTASTTRPEWYPQFRPALLDSAGTYDTATSSGTNYIASDCGTSFVTASLLPGDLCQDTGTGRLWYCKTPGGGGTNSGYCDADSELAPVQMTLVQSDCSSITQAGTFCVDSDDDTLYYGNGSSATAIAGGSGGYATVDDEDTPLTQRTTLNFEGAGVTCADDTDQTTCTIPGGSGSAIVLDIGDDGGDDSLDVAEIATTGDTNGIVSEPSADKILIDMGQNWPAADEATALAANGGNCSAGSYPLGVDASGAVESCTDATTEIDAVVATKSAASNAADGNIPRFDGTAGDLQDSGCNIDDNDNLSCDGGITAGDPGDGDRGIDFIDNTSTLEDANAIAAGDCRLGFVGGDLYKHCESGSLTPVESAATIPTHTECFPFYAPTDTIADSDDVQSLWRAPAAITITEVWCETDTGTVNMDLQIDDGTPADVMGTDLVCASTAVSDSSGLTGAMADGDRLDLAITSVASSPTRLTVCAEYTYD